MGFELLPRVAKELGALEIKRLAHSGRSQNPEMVSVGNPPGLHVQIGVGGGKSWVLRVIIAGKRRHLGLRSLNDVSLSQARDKARQVRAGLRAGSELGDVMQSVGLPMLDRSNREIAAPDVPRFQEWSLAWFKRAVAPTLRNPVSGNQWIHSFTVDCAAIKDIPIAELNRDDVLRVLRPIWTTKHETASRVRGRIERALDAATAAGVRPEFANPASWNLLRHELPPRQKLQRGRHASMAWGDVAGFYTQLAGRESMGALAHRWVILTGCRVGEALKATWCEIDLETKVWTVPASRMKAGREHSVPLSGGALQVLRLARLQAGVVSEWVFPSEVTHKPMTAAALEQVRERLGVMDVTTHGFRSSFRTWCAETGVTREVAELCLAHEVRNAVELAYARSDLLDARRAVLTDWAKICTGVESGGASVSMTGRGG